MRPPAAVLLAVLPLAACSRAPSGGPGEAPGASGARPAPDFELRSLDGKAFRLSSLKGTVVLMDFWATWCEPCKDSAPLFQKFFDRYRKDGFNVVGVSVDSDPEGIPAFLAEHKVSYPVLLDMDNEAMRLYRVRGIPNLFLLDRRGQVRKHWIGWDDSLRPVLEKEIQALLQEKA